MILTTNVLNLTVQIVKNRRYFVVIQLFSIKILQSEKLIELQKFFTKFYRTFYTKSALYMHCYEYKNFLTLIFFTTIEVHQTTFAIKKNTGHDKSIMIVIVHALFMLQRIRMNLTHCSLHFGLLTISCNELRRSVIVVIKTQLCIIIYTFLFCVLSFSFPTSTKMRMRSCIKIQNKIY